MKPRIALSAVALGMAFAAASLPVSAAVTIDQNQPLYDLISGTSIVLPMARFDNLTLAQSFQQTGANVAGAGIFLSNEGGNGLFDQSVTISLWTALPSESGATKLASASARFTSTEAQAGGAWLDVFWTPVSVTPGITYYLDFSSWPTLLGIGGTGDVYPYGQVYVGMEVPYKGFPQFDYTFRTYFDDAFRPDNGNGTVPEPATLGLLGVGLAGIGAIRRKKLAA